jgi:uncharacterized damage-inducible protein DinB
LDVNVPPVVDERAGLLGFLGQQRRVLKHAAYGLTGEQLRAAPSASSLTIGGLLKHVAFSERGWLSRVTGGPEPSRMPGYDEQFELSEADTLAGLLAAVDAAGAATEAAIAEIDLDRTLPVPKDHPLFQDRDTWTVRWVLFHLIEELARHAGHADIIRESIDGAQNMELLAAAEGWPETPLLKPWRPREPV